jgi:hypothetical protein
VVTLRALDGTLSDGLRWFLYPLGLILAVPGWLLVASSTPRRRTLLNAWLAIALIAQGSSAPLAVPAVLNLVYLRSASRWVERGVVAVSALLYAMLFAVGLTYVLTGRQF